MNKKISIAVLALLVLILIGAAVYSSQKNKKIDYNSDRQQVLDDLINRPTETITVKQQYKNGNYTVIGSFEVPTPCYSYNAEVIKKDGITEIAITYFDNSNPDTMCAQVISEKLFRVDFEGAPGENIVATINGEIVNLNVFEIGPDEIIENIELYIKG
ncbi:MAG TPA: hypothetical protein PKA60_00090 [Candidatus Paceibacterota bacterium]|nr:hypothetical protein [Candidatus Paceibacterota bacterium]